MGHPPCLPSSLAIQREVHRPSDHTSQRGGESPTYPSSLPLHSATVRGNRLARGLGVELVGQKPAHLVKGDTLLLLRVAVTHGDRSGGGGLPVNGK